MADMMPAVPRVEGERHGQRPFAHFRVNEFSRPLIFRHRTQQNGPAGVKCFNQLERHLGVGGTRVSESSPRSFVVGFDGRRFLGQRQPEADVTVDVAIGNVVNHLASRPAAFAVLEIESTWRQLLIGMAELGGQLLDITDPGFTIGGCGVGRRFKTTDRIGAAHDSIVFGGTPERQIPYHLR